MSLIKPLDIQTRKRIRSSYTFPSFSSIVEQLVLNSIDAGSSVIEIRYSLRGFNVTVDDNGVGVSYDDLLILGKPNHTSKMSLFDEIDQVVTYGFQGIMLHSLSSISRLEVTSRSRNSFQSYRKVVNSDDKTIPIIHSRHIGTTISCTDIFRTLSVRRLHLLSHINQEHEKIVTLIQKYSFVHPSVNFQLRHEQRILYQKQPTNSRKDLLQFFVHRVLKIGNSNEVEAKDFLSYLKPVNFTSKNGMIKIQGFLSENSIFSTTSYQWVFINKRIVNDNDLKRIIKNRYHQKRSRLKDTDSRQHPVFFLNVFVTNDSSSSNNNEAERKTDSSSILRMSSYHFEDRTFLYYKKEVVCSSISEFIRSFFSRGGVKLKGNEANEIVPPPPPRPSTQVLGGMLKQPIIGQSVEMSYNFRTDERKKKLSIQEMIRANSERNPVYISQQQSRWRMNNRDLTSQRSSENMASSHRLPLPPPPIRVRKPGKMIIKGSNLPKMNNMRRKKKKNTFQEEEEEEDPEKEVKKFHVFGYNTNHRSLIYTAPQEIKITKEVLSQMEVINQVDRKFIIIKSSSCVFAVDQHAADERVQLEKLENEVYHVREEDGQIVPNRPSRLINQYILTPPQKFTCTFLQNNVLIQNRSFFEHWFWEIQDLSEKTVLRNPYTSSMMVINNNQNEHENNNRTYHITRGPEVCGVRLGGAEFGLFLQHVGQGKGLYPKAVQNILSYKACRSAVKFGDYLSKGRCKEILRELRGCRLPFQCAHGRPSIQPLFRY